MRTRTHKNLIVVVSLLPALLWPFGALAAVSVPTNFIAKNISIQEVDLSWTASKDASYQVERSLDNSTWAVLTDRLAGGSYQDQAVVPDVHYYYRLSVLGSDDSSDFAYSDIATGAVLGAEEQNDIVITSGDKLATVTVRADSVPSGAQCSIAADERNSATGGMVAGPYELTCNTPAGAVKDFTHPLTWHFNLGERLRGYHTPRFRAYDADGNAQSLSSRFDSNEGILTGDAKMTKVAVLATKNSGAWVSSAIIWTIVITTLSVFVSLPFRTARKRHYENYLRAKYYNH